MKEKFLKNRMEYSLFAFAGIYFIMSIFVSAIMAGVNYHTFSNFMASFISSFSGTTTLLLIVCVCRSIKKVQGQTTFNDNLFNWLIFAILMLVILSKISTFFSWIGYTIYNSRQPYTVYRIPDWSYAYTIIMFIASVAFLYVSGFYKVQRSYVKSMLPNIKIIRLDKKSKVEDEIKPDCEKADNIVNEPTSIQNDTINADATIEKKDETDKK